jgi:hypothetical protein
MSYGMQIYDSGNNLYYDSTSSGGVFVENLALMPTQSSAIRYINYSQFAGKKLIVTGLYCNDISWTVFDGTSTYNGTRAAYLGNGLPGYPYIQYLETAPGLYRTDMWNPTILMVFVK